LIIVAAVILVGAAVFAGVMIVKSIKTGGGSATPSVSVSKTPSSPSASPTPSPSPTPTPSASPSPSTTVQDLPKSTTAIGQSVVIVPMRRGNDTDRPMFLVDTEGGDPIPLSTPLGNNSNPIMQASRDTIIYLNAGVLRVMAADGTGDRKLFNGDPAGCLKVNHASWSLADPNVLLISCEVTQDKFALLVVGMDGRLIRRLDAGKDIISEFALSPDGQTVVYAASDSSGRAGGALFSLPIIGTGDPKQLTDSADGVDDDPAWSPDGTQIAFRRRIPNGTNGGNFDVYVMAADGTGLRAIAETPAQDFKPVWSPDSKNLLIISNRKSAQGEAGKTYDLWLTRVSDKEVLANLGLKAKQITKPFWTLR
jgi:tricorn protease-like protein